MNINFCASLNFQFFDQIPKFPSKICFFIESDQNYKNGVGGEAKSQKLEKFLKIFEEKAVNFNA